MKYIDYLHLTPPDPCPFCHSHDRVFLENDRAYLTYALAPYHRHHLLVIPKRHVASFLDLDSLEREAVWDIVSRGAQLLQTLGYEHFSCMVREGRGGAKSIEHLHYHLIPEVRLGDLNHRKEERSVLSEEEVQAVSAEIAAALRSTPDSVRSTKPFLFR